MPDTSNHSSHPQHRPAPSDWHDAFSGMPLEAPDTSRWSAIAARLHDGTQVSPSATAPNQRVWLALAAGIALVAASGAWWWRASAPAANGAADTTAATIDVPAASAPDTADTTNIASTTSLPTAAVATTATSNAAHDATHSATAAPMTVATTKPVATAASVATRPRRHSSHTNKPRASSANQRSAMSAAPRVEGTSAPVLVSAPINASTGSPLVAATSTEDFEPLYTASAQLEALLALARDTRVESGPAAALSGALDAELASIDARLALPDLDHHERYTLWQARIEALQQIAGLESQLRLLAADGQRFDGALVSID